MSTHLSTSAVISSVGKEQVTGSLKASANDDGDGSRNEEPTLSSIAEEILDIFTSRPSPSEGEHQIAVFRLPVLKKALVSSDMARPGSSKELLCCGTRGISC